MEEVEGFKIYTCKDLMEMKFPPTKRRKWGKWKYNKRLNTLTHMGVYQPLFGDVGYEVDLDTCQTPEGMLEEILWLAGREWIDAEQLKAFCDAVNEIMRDEFEHLHSIR